MSFKFKLSVNVLCVCEIDNALNLPGIILERIQVFILLAVENNRSAVEVVAGLTSKSLHMWTVHGRSDRCFVESFRISDKKLSKQSTFFSENITPQFKLCNIYFFIIYSFYVTFISSLYIRSSVYTLTHQKCFHLWLFWVIRIRYFRKQQNLAD